MSHELPTSAALRMSDMCMQAGLSCMACLSRALLATLMPSLMGAVPGFAGADAAVLPSNLCSSRAPLLPAQQRKAIH